MASIGQFAGNPSDGCDAGAVKLAGASAKPVS